MVLPMPVPQHQALGPKIRFLMTLPLLVVARWLSCRRKPRDQMLRSTADW
jgi:hypothetical protein